MKRMKHLSMKRCLNPDESPLSAARLRQAARGRAPLTGQAATTLLRRWGSSTLAGGGVRRDRVRCIHCVSLSPSTVVPSKIRSTRSFNDATSWLINATDAIAAGIPTLPQLLDRRSDTGHYQYQVSIGPVTKVFSIATANLPVVIACLQSQRLRSGTAGRVYHPFRA